MTMPTLAAMPESCCKRSDAIYEFNTRIENYTRKPSNNAHGPIAPNHYITSPSTADQLRMMMMRMLQLTMRRQSPKLMGDNLPSPWENISHELGRCSPMRLGEHLPNSWDMFSRALGCVENNVFIVCSNTNQHVME